MKTNNSPFLDPADKIRAENESLKLKLELDHDMELSETCGLTLQQENQWLRSIYEFEKQYKERRRIKVYDFLQQHLHEN